MLQLVLQETSGHLPTSLYHLMDADVVLGFIQIRHKPSHSKDVPPTMASHIYYEIDPLYRGKGYGTELLRLGIHEAKSLGLNEVIVTCKEENVASKKIIEKNGGVFLESDQGMLKYNISTV